MLHPKVVLIAGFGNLGVKLLPLRWAFPSLRFEFVEKFWPGFLDMRQAFHGAGTLGSLLAGNEAQLAQLHPNVQAFRKVLAQTPGFTEETAVEDANLPLGKLFDDHIHFGGETVSGPDDPLTRDLSRNHQRLIRKLVEYDRSEVLLYLATRPEDYLWYLERYADFARTAAIDKPLAKDERSLADIQRFARVNPGLVIRPIDHYLFKLDFTRFNEELEHRGGLSPREVQRLDVSIGEESLDESRRYFLETGIIRDMMPHVAAMVSLLFRDWPVSHASVGNVKPFVYTYPSAPEVGPVIVQAEIELSYWTGEGYLPVSIRIAKGAGGDGKRKPPKEIVITWHTGQHQTINLGRGAGSTDYVDWGGALKYLMGEGPLAGELGEHFTFERACQITTDVFVCQEQADDKVRHNGRGGRTYFDYPAGPEGLKPLPETTKNVFVFNFDGVIVNTEEAYARAWRTWHEVVGYPNPDLDNLPWYAPGKSNRQMVSEALAYLNRDDESAASFAVQYAEKYYHVFAHILREEKLRGLESALPGMPGKAAEYHATLVNFLRLLRRYNQPVLLVTTNDALLVQQTLELLLRAGPGEGEPVVGFDRLHVGVRRGLDTYDEIVERYANHQVVIFDDYLDALVRLHEHYRGQNVRLVHMKTMKMGRKLSGEGLTWLESYEDFAALTREFARTLDAGGN
jgi:hypothetical protein